MGKSYADDFERRGYSVVRYALEPEYAGNKEKIAQCEFVFIAVPTPTTLQGFDDSILHKVIPLVGVGSVAVIKSTTSPGTVKKLQEAFPDRIILSSPEFLAEKTAAEDVANPKRNLVGLPIESPLYRTKAEELLKMLPQAPFQLIADATETELIKYAGNAFLLFKVLYANLFYDLTHSLGVDYAVVQEAIAADPRIGPSHLKVIDQSGHQGSVAGRGAGGHCLIKDFAALRALYERVVGEDQAGVAVLRALERKNIELLQKSGKDIDLLNQVYDRGAVS